MGNEKTKKQKLRKKKKIFFEDANKNGHHAKNCGKKPQHVRKKEISMKIKKFPELLKKHEKKLPNNKNRQILNLLSDCQKFSIGGTKKK